MKMEAHISNKGLNMKIYLASPLGFTESTRDFMERIELRLIDVGFEVINPWKISATEGKEILETNNMESLYQRLKTLHEINLKIGKNNEKAIKECDIVFAILDGTDVDSGTASEIGYGYGIGKKIFGYRGDFRLSADNLGSIVNLQVQYWIENSGGFIITTIDDIRKIKKGK